MKNFLLILLTALCSACLQSMGFLTQYTAIFIFFGFALMWQAEKYFSSFFERHKIRIWLFWSIFLFSWNVVGTWWVRITGALWVISTANTIVMLVPVGVWLWARKSVPVRYQTFLFAVVWIAFEFLHHRWQLTWVWLTLGNSFLYQNTWVQWYEYTGVLGGSLWILLGNIMAFKVIEKPKRKPLAFLALCIICPILVSYIILWQYPKTKKSDLEVLLVQPNINPFTEKFSDCPNFIPHRKQTEILLNLTERFVSPTTDLVVFPETAFDENFDERIIKRYENIKLLDSFYQSRNIPILFGASTRRFTAQKTSPTSQYAENVNAYYEDFNAAFLKQKDSLYSYKKIILVPGVETIPFPEYTIFLKDFISDIGASFFLLGVGKEQKVFSMKEARIAPIICYESMYGEFVGEFVKKGANLLCTITNDGWLGDTDWQQHHLYLGALRSIETRRTMLHCSNMGASAVISAKGEISKEIPYNQRTALHFSEVALHEQITFYVRFGDYLGIISLLLLSIKCFFDAILKIKKRLIEG